MSKLRRYAVIGICVNLMGCAEMIPTPQDQAVQIDFGRIYMQQLSAKYQPKNAADLGGCTNTAALTDNPVDGCKFQLMLNKYQYYSENDLDQQSKEKDATVSSSLKDMLNQTASEILKIDAEVARLRSQQAVTREKKSATSIALQSEQLELQTQRTILVARADRIKDEILKLEAKKYNSSEQKRKEIRDEIIRDFISIADHNYLHFKNEILAGRVRTDTIADIAELVLSTATTLTGGLNSKTNLSAASTLLKGGRSTVDKNFFAQQTMRAIVNSMENGRSEDRKKIIEKLNLPTTQYPVSEAIADVQQYQSRGSLFVAVLDLANQSGAIAADAERQLKEVEKKPEVSSTK